MNGERICSPAMYSAITLPFWIAGFGILCSILGMFLVKTDARRAERPAGTGSGMDGDGTGSSTELRTEKVT